MPLLSPKRWRMQPVRLPNLYGELYLPPACPEQSPDAVPINSPTFHEEVGRFTRPRPGLVVAPSSAGICDVRERHYARYFSDAGFVCLVVDCFTPRGLKQCADDQSRLSAREMNRDLLAGWNLLAGRADTDAGRIAVLGVSRGAGAALDMAMRLPFSACGHERFAAHVAISPPASIQPRRPVTTGAPILMLIGGQDDFTGTEPALRYADRLKTGGADITVHVFPEAHHAWESCGKPRYYPQVQCFRDCHFLLEDDGSYTDERTGENMSETELQQARLRCLRLGAHAGGGSAKLRNRTCELIRRFFSDHGLGENISVRQPE